MTSNERFEDTQKARSPVKDFRRLVCTAVVLMMFCLVLAVPASASGNVFINVFSAPEEIAQGASADFVINAEASNAGIQYYIIGTNFFEYGTVPTADDGTTNKFTVELLEGTTESMAEGEYFAVFQHPMSDGMFQIKADGTDIELNGDKIFNVADLQAAEAAQALCDALDAQTIDDLYVMYEFIVAGQGESSPSIPSLKDTYIVGIDAEYPPFTYLDADGNPIGVDVESIQWIAEQKGFNVIIQPISWDGIISALNAGVIDMIYSGMSITPERAELVTFSNPYCDVGCSVVVRSDSSAQKNDVLNGNMVIGVVRGSIGNDLLLEELGTANYDAMIKNGSIKLYDNCESSMIALENGFVEAVIHASYEVSVYLKETSSLREIEEVVTGQYAVAMRKDDTALHVVINEGIAELKSSGKWDELVAKYMGDSTSNPTPTPDKPAAPTLTEPESIPDDAEIKTNTVAETNAATKAEVGYQISPINIAEMKAPTITRGSLSVMLNDAVKVMKKLSDGSEVEVEATVNEDGSISITGSLDGAESVTVNFIGRQFGDTLGNGKVGAVSALKIAQNIVGLDSGKMSDTDKFYGDVNGDGNVKVVDALMIAQYTVGILDENYVRVA